MTSVLTLTSSVVPSGVARTTSCVPMLPEAPGLFSTKKGRLRRSERPGAIWRAIRSMPVPGVKGTIRRTGASAEPWARAKGAASAASPPSRMRRRCRNEGDGCKVLKVFTAMSLWELGDN